MLFHKQLDGYIDDKLARASEIGTQIAGIVKIFGDLFCFLVTMGRTDLVDAPAGV